MHNARFRGLTALWFGKNTGRTWNSPASFSPLLASSSLRGRTCAREDSGPTLANKLKHQRPPEKGGLLHFGEERGDDRGSDRRAQDTRTRDTVARDERQPGAHRRPEVLGRHLLRRSERRRRRPRREASRAI